MQDPVDKESSSDEDNFVVVSRPTRPPEKSPCSAPPGATSELEVTPELNINSLQSAEPPEAVENQQISDEETSNQFSLAKMILTTLHLLLHPLMYLNQPMSHWN